LLIQACGTTPSRLDISSPENSFDSQDLLAEFEQLRLFHGSHEESEVQEVEVTRPNKRRKVDKKEDGLDEIMSNLYQLLGLQDSTGHGGLRDITE
jgi:hypothetical protein